MCPKMDYNPNCDLLYLLVVTGRGFLDIFFFWSALEVASSIFEIS